MTDLPHVPEKRQSVRPPRSILLAIVGVFVIMGIVWLVVSLAVASGGQDCPVEGTPGAVAENCR